MVVQEGQDCGGADDVVVGNGQCDLAAGTYGTIVLHNHATVIIAGGTSVACGIRAGKNVRFASSGPATMLIPVRGNAYFNNEADVGTDCGGLRIVTERGDIRFGRSGRFTVDACSLAGSLKLGHANTLSGHYLGDVVSSDRNNTGVCCPTTTTTTTTTTSTSEPSTSSIVSTTTAPSSSSTSSSSSSSSTSTSLPDVTYR